MTLKDQLQLLTTKEAASLYKKSVAWFERARWLGPGYGPPYSKLGRSVRYHPADLKAYFERNRVA